MTLVGNLMKWVLYAIGIYALVVTVAVPVGFAILLFVGACMNALG